ncbi:MAG: galactose-1-epimerase [Pseudozobellia sp.]|nr:galactose-1-epimerase [Pseudozobellia sp.]|tara:strand:+ start:2112 stop:3284 length:1173 start_codon:yes stop_codon:yes gene_type:complete
MKLKLFALSILLTVVFSCKQEKKQDQPEQEEATEVMEARAGNLNAGAFDTIVDGDQVKLYWLKNDDIEVAITNYGGRIVGLFTPDTKGDRVDVVIGRGSVKEYIDGPESYFGALIGRVGNRIAGGKFDIDGKNYSVETNNGKNALHGGPNGFQDKVWKVQSSNDTTLVLNYLSEDMEEGFPGALDAKVTYHLIKPNTLRIEYEAVTDKPTIVNLTNHAYFNLNGEGSGNILDHEMILYADKFTPVDETLIPTGELKEVKNTPFDFIEPHRIGERIEAEDTQIKYGGGYDHNFVLSDETNNSLKQAATVVGDKSGVVMEVFTTEPGVQFYSGNFMNAENKLKSGARDEHRSAFCLETQHYPDSPNQKNFPTIRLNPGEEYHTMTEYRFSTK